MKITLFVHKPNRDGTATCQLKVTRSFDGKLIHSHTMQVSADDVRQGQVQAVVDYTLVQSAEGRSSKR